MRRRRAERGAVLVFVAPLFLTIFAMAALVVDMGNARQEARHVQGAVDAASLAGARELPLASSSTTAADRAKQKAKNVNPNITGQSVIPGPVPCTGTVPINSPATRSATPTWSSPRLTWKRPWARRSPTTSFWSGWADRQPASSPARSVPPHLRAV